MPGILISYRREDTAAYAGRLYDGLSERYGDSQVFMDISTLQPGVDFVAEIERAVATCDVELVVIGKRWVSVADAQGRRRLDNPEDFVRLEVAAGLNRGVRVIPVLVDGATMPTSDDLPAALQALARHNAIELSDARWRYDLSRLISGLDAGRPPTPVHQRDESVASAAQVSPIITPGSDASAQVTCLLLLAVWLVGAGLAESLFFISRLPLAISALRGVSVGWMLSGFAAGLLTLLAISPRSSLWKTLALAVVAGLAAAACDAVVYAPRVVRGPPNLQVALTSGATFGGAICGAAGAVVALAATSTPAVRRIVVVPLAAAGAAVGFSFQWQMGWPPQVWVAGLVGVAVWALLLAQARNRQRLATTATPSVA